MARRRANTGFIHDVIATPAESAGTGEEPGTCRPSCDPRVAGRKGRVRHVVGDPNAVAPSVDDPRAFASALFQFAIVVPQEFIDADRLQRDMAFRFQTKASFAPLRTPLSSESRRSIQIQSLQYLPSTDEIVVTDGALEGLLMVPGDLIGDIRQFF